MERFLADVALGPIVRLQVVVDKPLLISCAEGSCVRISASVWLSARVEASTTEEPRATFSRRKQRGG